MPLGDSCYLMRVSTRRIGLSLGADLCWPICYEEILDRFRPSFEIDGETVGFHVKRLDIEPFDLQQACPYDVVLDRVTHWYHTSREWIKKSILMDGLYVLNNPWSIQSLIVCWSARERVGPPSGMRLPTGGLSIETFW